MRLDLAHSFGLDHRDAGTPLAMPRRASSRRRGELVLRSWRRRPCRSARAGCRARRRTRTALGAPAAQLRLVRARLVVEAGVDHAAVVPGLVRRRARTPSRRIDQRQRGNARQQSARGREADDAAADDGHVVCHRPPYCSARSPLLQRQKGVGLPDLVDDLLEQRPLASRPCARDQLGIGLERRHAFWRSTRSSNARCRRLVALPDDGVQEADHLDAVLGEQLMVTSLNRSGCRACDRAVRSCARYSSSSADSTGRPKAGREIPHRHAGFFGVDTPSPWF